MARPQSGASRNHFDWGGGGVFIDPPKFVLKNFGVCVPPPPPVAMPLPPVQISTDRFGVLQVTNVLSIAKPGVTGMVIPGGWLTLVNG